MIKTYIPIGLVITVAFSVSILIGRPGMSGAKLAGMGLAVILVVPVFLYLLRVFTTDSPNYFLGVFVGGFLFKLLMLLAGVWYGVVKMGWDKIEFSVSCLAFLLALQAAEALFFWGRQRTLDKSETYQ